MRKSFSVPERKDLHLRSLILLGVSATCSVSLGDLKGGRQPGVGTELCMLPSEDLACMVLTNRTDESPLANAVCDEILTMYVPDWTRPEENAYPAPSPFVLTRDFAGRWEGTLSNGGAKMRVRLEVESSTSATLTLGNNLAGEDYQYAIGSFSPHGDDPRIDRVSRRDSLWCEDDGTQAHSPRG
jgi:hypothetical protein